MGVAVSLDKKLVDVARSYSNAMSRSVPKQIEHWAKVGRIAEDNPDLSYRVIMEILRGVEDVKNNDVEEYKKGML